MDLLDEGLKIRKCKTILEIYKWYFIFYISVGDLIYIS